jgi:hypothetical protein
MDAYKDMIERPWHRMKRRYFGGASKALHACELRNPTKVQISALNTFFDRPFARFAAVASSATSIAPQLDGHGTVAMALRPHLEEVASAVDADSMVVIFEASERTDDLLLRDFSGLQAHRNGQPIPFDIYKMPKSAQWAALEVADFVAHTAGCQVRHSMTRTNFRLDFQAMFHDRPAHRASFMNISSVEPAPSVSATAQP